MARPNPLADPDFAKDVAEMFAAGCSRQEMCDAFGVKDKDTITRWRRDARVKALALKIIEDRVLQVTRKVDGVIAARLEDAENMTVQELLAIRKEFLGGALRAQTEKADEETIQEAQEFLESNPNAMDELEDILRGRKTHPAVPTE
jgi:transcriptional regulator with XRE-family HTH domain